MTTGAERPRIGTALRAFLSRYLEDLRAFDKSRGDRLTRQMIECAEFILTEGDRQKGANHD
ncbi:MAG: hypothetical protein R2940_16285 [Syntrophotaleaceae bacterium]